jgi:hypothetical protein
VTPTVAINGTTDGSRYLAQGPVGARHATPGYKRPKVAAESCADRKKSKQCKTQLAATASPPGQWQ